MDIEIESYTAVGVASQDRAEHAQVWLPPGYTLTGGGTLEQESVDAYTADTASETNQASTLASCYPIRNAQGLYTGWAAAGNAAGAVLVYATGIRVTRGGVPVQVEQAVFCASSALVAEPGVCARLTPGWIGTGGGAQDSCAGPAGGNVLTSSLALLAPDGKICGWSAAGKDPSAADQARVTAFVIGIRGADGIALDANLVRNASLMTGALAAAQERRMMRSASCPVVWRRDAGLNRWHAARKAAMSTARGPIKAYCVVREAS